MMRQRLRRGVLQASVAFVLSHSFAPAVAAQEPTERARKNSVYLEVLGASWLGSSINYERMLTSRYNVRLGGGFFVDEDYVHSELIIMPNVVFGKRHQFTGGIGAQIWFPSSECFSCTGGGDVGLVFEVGYRYTAKFGLLFKGTLGMTVFRGATISDTVVFPLPGVSLGWSF